VEDDRYVDWDDIEGRVEGDDCYCEAPWEHSDGWEHEFESVSWRDRQARRESYTFCNRKIRNGGNGFIIVDDSMLYDGPSGCSKQVRFETLARARRKATEQLVKWYENGWHVYVAIAEYKDYSDSLGGIYDDEYGDYALECAEECRNNVADEMERDGYVIENRPDPPKPYSRVDAFRDAIRRNMNGGW